MLFCLINFTREKKAGEETTAIAPIQWNIIHGVLQKVKKQHSLMTQECNCWQISVLKMKEHTLGYAVTCELSFMHHYITPQCGFFINSTLLCAGPHITFQENN